MTSVRRVAPEPKLKGGMANRTCPVQLVSRTWHAQYSTDIVSPHHVQVFTWVGMGGEDTPVTRPLGQGRAPRGAALLLLQAELSPRIPAPARSLEP